MSVPFHPKKSGLVFPPRSDYTPDTLGFLSCAPDLPYETMLEGLAPLQIIGGTSLGDPLATIGDPFEATLTCLSQEHTRHFIGVSPPLTPDLDNKWTWVFTLLTHPQWVVLGHG